MTKIICLHLRLKNQGGSNSSEEFTSRFRYFHEKILLKLFKN